MSSHHIVCVCFVLSVQGGMRQLNRPVGVKPSVSTQKYKKHQPQTAFHYKIFSRNDKGCMYLCKHCIHKKFLPREACTPNWAHAPLDTESFMPSYLIIYFYQ